MKDFNIPKLGVGLLISLSFVIACGNLSPIPIRQAAVRFKMHRQDFDNCGITLVDITIDNGRWKGRLDKPPVGTLYAERRLIVDEGRRSYQARSDEREQHPGEYITWGPTSFETDYPREEVITLTCDYSQDAITRQFWRASVNGKPLYNHFTGASIHTSKDL